MVQVYQLNDIALGEPSYSSGHEVYPEAYYNPTPDNLRGARKVIYKKNKHDDPKYSRMEVAFGGLFALCAAPNLTTDQRLVVDENEITGLVVRHQCYIVAEKEGEGRRFFSFNESNNYECIGQTVDAPEEIRLYFLSDLPHGFFGRLLEAERRGMLSIDYSSLASVLATSYTLEEDDLHKGNLGFYLVEKDGKPQVVFFKIDHDLLFADSIMSFHQRRFAHHFNGAHAFDFSAEDILNFPFIRSANAYWPTKTNSISPFWSSKVYRYAAERESFASLAANPQFQREKWKSFYKHILLPEELIKASLRQSLDESKEIDRAQIALITQATIARQAKLRALLCSLPEFRQFLLTLTARDKQDLVYEISGQAAPIVDDLKVIMGSVQQALYTNEQLCRSEPLENKFEAGDNPIHTAIKLGDYRYEETLSTFGKLINQKNEAGKTPLDVALDMVRNAEHHPEDIREDLRFTIKHLIYNGATPSPAYEAFNAEEHIETYRFQTPYVGGARRAKTYDELKNVLRDIGEDSSLCLKFKKKFAVDCIAQFIQSNQDNPNLRPILQHLKREISQGGDVNAPESAALQFIRQLRSTLWIIRKIRGVFGWTTTQGEINDLINNQLKRLPENKANRGCFFSKTEEKEPASDESLDLDSSSGLERG